MDNFYFWSKKIQFSREKLQGDSTPMPRFWLEYVRDEERGRGIRPNEYVFHPVYTSR